MRLNKVLGKLVHDDQAGFILGRQVVDNIRMELNVIWTARRSGDPALLVSLDAEKTFDQAAWKFLIFCVGSHGVWGRVCELDKSFVFKS